MSHGFVCYLCINSIPDPTQIKQTRSSLSRFAELRSKALLGPTVDRQGGLPPKLLCLQISRRGSKPPLPCSTRTAYSVLNFASFCLDFESLWGISMESKQEHLVFAADPEIQLALLLCKKTLGVKARVYKIGWGEVLKTSRTF